MLGLLGFAFYNIALNIGEQTIAAGPAALLIQTVPIWTALAATVFTWLLTALGAALVLAFREFNRKVLDGMLGFAAGVMTAASFWSLLAPAIAMAEADGVPGWLPAVVGFLAGGAFLWIVDGLLPHLHPGFAPDQAEGIKTGWQRSTLLVLAITLHTIPEGLAVGVAFGAAAQGLPAASHCSRQPNLNVWSAFGDAGL